MASTVPPRARRIDSVGTGDESCRWSNCGRGFQQSSGRNCSGN